MGTTTTKQGVGRPYGYNTKILKKTKKYLKECVDQRERIEKQISKDGENIVLETQLVVKLPNIAGLARYLGVARSSIYEWKKDHEDFSDILDAILAEQEHRLITGGLSGSYNSTIAKLILTKHGYSDKIDQDITSKGNEIKGVGVILDKAYGDGEPDEEAGAES